MIPTKVLATVASWSIFGVILSTTSGCDSSKPSYTEADKDHAVGQAQARTAAYGKSTVPTGKGTPAGQSRQSSARRAGR